MQTTVVDAHGVVGRDALFLQNIKGAAIGPLIGGMLLQYFWWGSVFLINVPVMLLLLALGPMLLPEYRDPKAGRLDLTSAALSLAAVLAAIYGLKRIAEDGLAWVPALSILFGLALGFVFVRRQSQLADPLIDLRLFRVRAFRAALATYMLACFVLFGIYIFIGQYLQLVLELSPLMAGLWSVPWALAFVVGSMLTPALVRRCSAPFVVAAGLTFSALGFGLLALLGVQSGPGLALMVSGTVILSLGLAPVFTLATDLVLGAAPPERTGAASAISETSSEFGGALGIAIFGSIGTALYRAAMVDVSGDGVPPELMEAARGTLGAATAAAQLPGPAGAALLDVARGAFLQGLRLTAILAAAAMLGAGLFAVTMLRRNPQPTTSAGKTGI